MTCFKILGVTWTRDLATKGVSRQEGSSRFSRFESSESGHPQVHQDSRAPSFDAAYATSEPEIPRAAHLLFPLHFFRPVSLLERGAVANQGAIIVVPRAGRVNLFACPQGCARSGVRNVEGPKAVAEVLRTKQACTLTLEGGVKRCRRPHTSSYLLELALGLRVELARSDRGRENSRRLSTFKRGAKLPSALAKLKPWKSLPAVAPLRRSRRRVGGHPCILAREELQYHAQLCEKLESLWFRV
jgi:hypothetical protein